MFTSNPQNLRSMLVGARRSESEYFRKRRRCDLHDEQGQRGTPGAVRGDRKCPVLACVVRRKARLEGATRRSRNFSTKHPTSSKFACGNRLLIRKVIEFTCACSEMLFRSLWLQRVVIGANTDFSCQLKYFLFSRGIATY